MVRLLGTTWGRPAGIEVGQDHDPLSEATGLKAQPGIGQIEYSTSYGANLTGPTVIAMVTRRPLKQRAGWR